MDMAQNILVIKTVSGMAMAVAAALDALQMNSIVGCIAGDDTIMVPLEQLRKPYLLWRSLVRLLIMWNRFIYSEYT